MTIKKIFIILISVVAILLVVWAYLAISGLTPDYSPTFEKVKLINTQATDSVFIKKKVWGVSADHQVISISQNGEIPFSPDTTNDFIFNTWSPFFYEFEKDTLTVFVSIISKKPQNFNSDITVKQKILTNPEMMNLFDTYKEKGLNLLSR